MMKIDTSIAALKALAAELDKYAVYSYNPAYRAVETLRAVADEKEAALERLTRIDEEIEQVPASARCPVTGEKR